MFSTGIIKNTEEKTRADVLMTRIKHESTGNSGSQSSSQYSGEGNRRSYDSK